MTDRELEDLAQTLFDAFVVGDLDLVESLLAPNARLCTNGNENPWELARPAIAALRGVIGDHRYTDVRRTVGHRTVVEEHHVVSTTPDGRELDLPACVVIRVDDDGLIVELDEYVDTAPLSR